jgi:hypothetical protein
MSSFKLLALVLLLAVVHFVAFSIGGTVFEPPLPEGAVIDPATSAAALAVMCLANAGVLALLIRNARVRGWRLLGAVMLLFWGASTFMSQMEVAFFSPDSVPDGSVAMIVGMGTVNAVLTVPFAVWLLTPEGALAVSPERPGFLVPKLLVNAVMYVTIYLLFGYFVAMRSPALLEYYQLTDPGSFTAQLAHIAAETPMLFPLQFVRGILWSLLIYPAVLCLRGPWWVRGSIIGLALGGFMNFQLLLPNPLMPWSVGSAHFLETFPSNVLFGLLATGVLSFRRPAH